MSWKRNGRKRLQIDIPEDLHVSLNLVAKKRNITVTRYVVRALIRFLLEESKYDNK